MRLAKIRWRIEHDYRELKTDLPGLGLADRPAWFDYTWTGRPGERRRGGRPGKRPGRDAPVRLPDRQIGGFVNLADGEGEVWRRFGVTTQEYYVLLDKGGAIVHKGALPPDALRDRVTALAG